MRFNRWAFTACVAATLVACGGGNNNNPYINVEITGLENLGATSVYEGWLIVAGAAKSAGRFTVNDSGVMSQKNFQIAGADLDGASAYVLTIEPQNDTDPGPTSTHLVAGNFVGGSTQASLSVAHPSALGDDFTSATGTFFLDTPTNGVAGTENQGIWFVDPRTTPASAGLTLPALPAQGWVYEGWVVVDGTPTSTGRFTLAAGPDSDGAGTAAGTLPAPPFPGQDFINPAKTLPGGVAVISIEPQPDNSPKPFLLKPLITNPIGRLTGPANLQTMVKNALQTNPTGTVKIVR